MADPGDIICYNPGDTVKNNLDEYEHWPVQKDVFKKTYKPWNDPTWRPNLSEAQLMQHGCRPYYKFAGVWALRLPLSIYLQSLESPQPVIVPKGRWLCIGADGEPYHMTDESLHTRYIVPENV